MAENKLTDRHLRNLKPALDEQLLGDGGGLWVRVLPISKGGSLNFYYRFQFSGKERRFNCGSYPDTTLAQAREKRNIARALVKSGIDPVAKEENDRIARSTAQAMERMEKTVKDLFEDWERVYLSAHRKDGGTAVKAAVERDVLPVIGSMKAKDVRLPHVVQVIDRILERKARRTANMVLSLMRQMFRHGLGRGIVETDPTLALSKKQAGGKETPVDRNLNHDEIKDLSHKLGNCGLHVTMQASIRFLLATGARIGELLKARWADIDSKDKTWTIPAENSKNSRQHLIHLSAYARKQLEVLKSGRPGPYLLNGMKPGTLMSDKSLSKAIRDRIRSEPLQRRTAQTGKLLLAGGEWSPHDLRRTMASRMGDLGIEPHIIERCLNHIQQGIVGVYQRQEYLAERKAAFEKWGRKLASLSR
ncbi:MAG: tyrosine-type recombinase/integrase [Gammaproteobacteria bacterium]|nr:tyrosine-type recombinase/integrase [Gammaproteobacteria bacterium]MBU1646808.1 tyrosine-type recombinase/integrase [Gammaproteobacteria bacterium]